MKRQIMQDLDDDDCVIVKLEYVYRRNRWQRFADRCPVIAELLIIGSVGTTLAICISKVWFSFWS